MADEGCEGFPVVGAACEAAARIRDIHISPVLYPEAPGTLENGVLYIHHAQGVRLLATLRQPHLDIALLGGHIHLGQDFAFEVHTRDGELEFREVHGDLRQGRRP